MKNMKMLLKKAMVWAVAASMLVATPLTASAAGIRGVFSVSDGEEIIKDNGTDTGTVTNTNSNTGVLSENEARIIGFALDQTYVSTEIGAKPELHATVILDGAGTDDPELVKAINQLIRWETSDLDKLSVDAKASDRTVATLKPKKAADVGEEVTITASIGGKYPFTWVDKETGREVYVEGSDVYREATAKVFIKEYAQRLSFTKEAYGKEDGVIVKHKVDMNTWLVKDPATANDNITWSISKTSAATISDDGVVTVKKFDSKRADNNSFVVTAVSEKGAKASAKLTVAAGTPATSVKIFENSSDVAKTRAIDMGGTKKETSFDVTAVMYAKMDTPEGKKDVADGETYVNKDGETVALNITDEITWSSNKPLIVSVKDHEDGTATLTPVATGTAKITATATSGKKATFNVKVSATLDSIEIINAPETAYTGQSITMEVERDPAANKDALKWEVKLVNANGGLEKTPDATISAKGVLKIKGALKYPNLKVRVTVTSKKDATKTDFKDITLAQSSISDITVSDDKGMISRVYIDGTKTKTAGSKKTEIRVPLNGVYKVQVGENDLGGVDSLYWTYPTNNKVVEFVSLENGVATFKAVAKGSAKMTVSGVYVSKKNDDGSAKSTKTIKAQFTVSVIQPTKSVSLNKSEIVLYEKTNKKKELQDQTVSLKATLNPKGAADNVTWTVYKNGVLAGSADYDTTKSKSSGKNNVSYKLVLKTPALGDVYEVRATAQTGVSATARINVVMKPTAIEIHNKKGGTQFSEENGNKTVKNTKYVNLGENFTMYPEIKAVTDLGPAWFEAGIENYTEGVTYTQSGKGKVIIIGNEVYGVKEGKVTITAKTPNNKKTTLKVEVKAPTAE